MAETMRNNGTSECTIQRYDGAEIVVPRRIAQLLDDHVSRPDELDVCEAWLRNALLLPRSSAIRRGDIRYTLEQIPGKPCLCELLHHLGIPNPSGFLEMLGRNKIPSSLERLQMTYRYVQLSQARATWRKEALAAVQQDKCHED